MGNDHVTLKKLSFSFFVFVFVGHCFRLHLDCFVLIVRVSFVLFVV